MRGAFGLLLLVLWCAATNAEQAPRIAGAAQSQFSWQSARCDTWDIPDTPARAWRVAGGLVHLVAGAERSRAMVGPSLSQTQRTCQSVFAATGQDDPAAWDDRGWIAATFTPDGQQVIALAHMEYHGHLRRDRCPLGSYADCWFNGVIEVQSQDGGHSFTRIGGGADLVAALPVRFQGDAGRRLGYFNPSNIVQRGDRLYASVFAEAFGLQRRGPCLFSRPVAGSAADWRLGWSWFYGAVQRSLWAGVPARCDTRLHPGSGFDLHHFLGCGTARHRHLAGTDVTGRRWSGAGGNRHLLGHLPRSGALDKAAPASRGAVVLATRLYGPNSFRLPFGPR
jgi:hypothetical protein